MRKILNTYRGSRSARRLVSIKTGWYMVLSGACLLCIATSVEILIDICRLILAQETLILVGKTALECCDYVK